MSDDWRNELRCVHTDPCAYDHTCRNHRRVADLVAAKDAQIAALEAEVERLRIQLSKAIGGWEDTSMMPTAQKVISACPHELETTPGGQVAWCVDCTNDLCNQIARLSRYEESSDALAPFVALAKAAQMMLDEIHFHFGCDSLCETARHVALAHPAVQRAVKEGP